MSPPNFQEAVKATRTRGSLGNERRKEGQPLVRNRHTGKGGVRGGVQEPRGEHSKPFIP